jgi:uncharacterized membrane protein YeaQ/YmgE (transglycosylase-associated protein family)
VGAPPRYAPRMVSTVIGAMILAFITGALARFALPGPDPMPPWLTVVIGLGGSAIGVGIGYAVAGKSASWAGIASFIAAVGLVVIYRRFVQKRPLWGPGAHRFPERGFGVENYRERLKRVGIDPDRIGTQPYRALQPMQVETAPPRTDDPGDPTENPAHYLGLLEDLHDAGVLDDEQYDAARTRLLESLRA